MQMIKMPNQLYTSIDMYHITALLVLLGSTVQSANILTWFICPSFSHQAVFRPIIVQLAKRGHNLTTITPSPINDPSLTTLDEVDVEKVSHDIWKKHNISLLGVKDDGDIQPMVDAIAEILDMQLAHPRVQDLIHNTSKHHFDLILVELAVPFGAIFSHIYNASLIGISSTPLHFFDHSYVGNPRHPGLFPELNLPYGNKLTFIQRVYSVVNDLLSYWRLNAIRAQYLTIMVSHFGADVENRMKAITKSFDLVFVNYNPILFVPRPQVPAVITFHGVHIMPPQELPESIRAFLDSSIQDIVYISFGSNIKSTDLPAEKQSMIMDALSELPFRFLWKFEDNLAKSPENVMLMNWVPQQDVLNHPKVKLFITQGGLQSLDEAMYSETPVLVIPFFLDQLGNAEKVVEQGLGKSLSFKAMSKERLKVAILDIINDDTYALRMKQVHDILTDEPMSALDKTVWWIEFALRHKGVKHMRCPTLDATFIEYYMIDVTALLLGVLAMLLFFIYIAAKLIMQLASKCCSLLNTPTSTEKLKKN